jgi:3-phenylpropionate/trans-cinnamate dioxygenase ferredoxin reductase subunit
MNSKQTFVIVGGGLTGAKAAETLRTEGFSGRIVLIGAEPDRPYERPPLSKEFLRGEAEGPPFVHEETYYSEHDIELETGIVVSAIDPDAREVVIEPDRRLRYDSLLLSTGAEPRRLPIPGDDLDGVHYLRDLGNSRAIGERFSPGQPLVVVGAGWIGAEVAASARQKGCEVTLIERGSLPLQTVLGDELGTIYRDVHVDNGVKLLPETAVERFEGDKAVERVITADGTAIETGFVVVGIGVVPRVELAEAAGLPVDNGVLVGADLASDVSGIFAAGDVANAQHPFYGHRLRVEHWANALNQGPAAAKSMLGQPVSYDEIPYFFSDQFDTGMEYSGLSSRENEVVFRGDREGREFIAFWIADDRVVAGMNFNVWDVHDEIRELIRSRARVNRDALTDPDTPLDQVAGAAAG